MFGAYEMMALPAVSGAFMVLAAVAMLFWLWMFIDCVQRPDNKFPAKGRNDKVIWVITLLLITFLGAVLYYALVKSKKK